MRFISELNASLQELTEFRWSLGIFFLERCYKFISQFDVLSKRHFLVNNMRETTKLFIGCGRKIVTNSVFKVAMVLQLSG